MCTKFPVSIVRLVTRSDTDGKTHAYIFYNGGHAYEFTSSPVNTIHPGLLYVFWTKKLKKVKAKGVFRFGLGECVYRISGLYLFCCGQKAPYRHTNQQIHKATYLLVKIGISSTGCSLHMDFDICQPDDEKSGNTVGCGALKISPIDFLC